MNVCHRESSAHKAALLKLDTSGRMAVNVVDNLVVVHHPASKVTYRFVFFLPAGHWVSGCSATVVVVVELPQAPEDDPQKR